MAYDHCPARPSSRFRIGTFNVRGLSSNFKREELDNDCTSYKIDVLAIQETKCDEVDISFPSGNRLITFNNPSKHGGIGFMLSKRVIEATEGWKIISDRVAYVDFSYGSQGKQAHTRFRVISAYGPTQPNCQTNPQLRNNFYDSLHTAWNTGRITWIGGDFNSKTGTNEDKSEIERCVLGHFGMGDRNENGEALIEWCIAHNAVLANTWFKHPCRHRTSWTGFVTDQSNQQTRPVYNQIDYIISKHSHRALTTNARSYGGTRVTSDHKLVLADMKLLYPYLARTRNTRHFARPNAIATDALQNEGTRRIYKEKLEEAIYDMEPHQQTNLRELIETTTNTARLLIGETAKPPVRFQDPALKALSDQRKAINIKLSNDYLPTEQRSQLRRERNRVSHEVRRQCRMKTAERLDALADEVENGDEANRVFKAARQLKKQQPYRPICVTDSDNRTAAQPQQKAAIFAKWYAGTASDGMDIDESIRMGTLQAPISTIEVLTAFKLLKNDTACGPDETPGELLKYAPSLLAEKVADVINNTIEQGFPLAEQIGHGILVPLAKPNKPRGPCSNLRPITLLKTIRKVISLIVIKRIRPSVELYLSDSQSGFRPGRSTADGVWAMRFLAARAQHQNWSAHLLGLDLSKAFDTIDRHKLLLVMADIVDEDALRLIRILLAKTTVQVRVEGALSEIVHTRVGVPQGDGLSPLMFNCYLEACMKEVRAELPPRPITDDIELLESQYADDCNWYSTNLQWLQSAIQIIAAIFSRWKLVVNETKTEWVALTLTDGVDRGKEDWRRSRQLGSLLGDLDDIHRRKSIATAALRSLYNLFSRRDRVGLKRRIRLYNAFVLPILTYNSSTWGATRQQMLSISAFHRKQLRSLLGIRWPNIISNVSLYTRTGTPNIAETIDRSRRRLFGHCLRMARNTPAQLAMDGYFSHRSRGRRGRHRTALPSVLASDMKTLGLRLKSATDLDALRTLAADRTAWRHTIVEAAGQ